MSILSVIIPNRNSPFLTKTISDLLEKAVGDIEIVVNVDENWPEVLVDDPRVIYIHPGTSRGMRWGINACANVAKGKYLMKLDDHCMVAPGFDKELTEHCADNWVVVPSRYSLDAENWKIDNNGKARRDYHYLCFPYKGKAHDDGMHGVEWWDRGKERLDPKYDIDDTMSLQGSCWFVPRDYFLKVLGGMHEEGYGQFAQEAQEIGNKTWLGGGELKTNKKTFYCHLHKGSKYGRFYKFDDRQHVVGSNWSAKHWMNNEEPGMVHKMEWLIEKFWPVPTWQDNWKEVWASYDNNPNAA